MNDVTDTADFYLGIAPVHDFGQLAGRDCYVALPDSWLVGTSDIIASSRAVAEGRYKTVNMVGAAVISAQINAHEGQGFPYIFGGDGAGFAVPPGWAERASRALAAVQTWAEAEFGMALRIGMVSVADIRAAGLDVCVARFKVSDGADYAMFTGGGLSWAESRMKDGAHTVPPAPPGTQPDLTGLSCRWSHMPSTQGAVLSMVILPALGVHEPDFTRFLRKLLKVADGLDRAGHPARPEGPGVGWQVSGTSLEARAQRAQGGLGRAWLRSAFESAVYWLLLRTGLQPGGFDAQRYRRVTGENADFRKFDDGLKMTLDCDLETERLLRTILEAAEDAGIARFGIYRQDEAMMTCIVPSILTDDHVHFVDGASGGYCEAARQIKDSA